mmetsp:Transcript_33711/g.80647  ORF Transcript_33711/g.80647 Transcript_33711/m.80647 type:complete len:106 (-) Transcript_33711:11-328(-)
MTPDATSPSASDMEPFDPQRLQSYRVAGVYDPTAAANDDEDDEGGEWGLRYAEHREQRGGFTALDERAGSHRLPLPSFGSGGLMAGERMTGTLSGSATGSEERGT